MKKLLILLAIFCVPRVNAQPYLISFAGTGASGTVSSINVQNLTAGTSVTLNGTDVLRLTVVSGVYSVENSQSSDIKIFPNPMTGKTILQIYPPEAGDAVISVFDMTGKLVVQKRSYLDSYLQEFQLSGINYGFYLVSVKGNTYQYSGKLLSKGKADGIISMEKISNNQVVAEKVSKMDSKGTQATIDMAYTAGDRLLFKGISGSYSTIVTDIPVSDKTISFTFIPCTDYDNNNYPVVAIGSQVWMAENLKTTKYNDGTAIPLEEDNTNWNNLTTHAYCWYQNNEATYKAPYGAIYNWYVVDAASNGGKNACPTGWHVPSDTDLSTLLTSLGGAGVAGGKLKETGLTHWETPNTEATNESGFTAISGGLRNHGTFVYIGKYNILWSTSVDTPGNIWRFNIIYNNVAVDRDVNNPGNGFSVRCMKD